MRDLSFEPLSAFADITMGQSPGAESCNSEDRGLPFLQGCAEFGPRHPSTAISCSPPLRVAKAGSVLISVRAPVGTMNHANQDYCIGRGLAAFKAKPGLANGIFLKHAVEQSAGYLHRRSQGSTFAAVSSGDVRTVPIPNFGFDDQEALAAIFSTTDTAIEKTEALIEKYQQIKAGLMHDLFTRGVLPNGQLRPQREQAPELYQESMLGWLPKDWGLCRIEDCGEVKLGRQRSPDQHSGKWPMPYLRVANVFDGVIDLSDVLEMDFTPNERRLFSLVDGDILLNEGQSLELVGRSSIYRGEPGRFCFQNTLVRFRCNSENAPTFFGYLFKLWLDGGKFQCIAKQTTSVAHLGADRFARMLCPAVEVSEQLRIAERLGLIDKQIDGTKAYLRKLKKQKLGLMQDLLTGKVQVKVAAKTMESVGG